MGIIMSNDALAKDTNYGEDWRPRPDPTILTTEQLHREIQALESRVTIRFDGMDKAQSLFESNLTRVPTDVDKQITHLRTLHDEKFVGLEKQYDEKISSIQKQFVERDTRTEQTSRDSKVAVDAALQAAKEAVAEQNRSSALAIAKSEAATSKQIDQQGTLITTATNALNDKIDDLKQRLTRIEGMGVGQLEAKTEQHSSTGLTISIIVSVFSLIGLVVSVIALITRVH